MKQRIIVFLASFLTAFGCLLCSAADPTAWTLKTPAPDAARFKPFLDGISSLKSDLENSRQIPADATSRLTQVKSQSSSFQQQSQSLASALKQNGESAAFDTIIAERLRKAGGTELIAEIQKQGGAFAVLSNSKGVVDKELAEITTKINVTAPKAAHILLDGILQLVETQDAEAAIRIRCPITAMWYLVIGVNRPFADSTEDS